MQKLAIWVLLLALVAAAVALYLQLKGQTDSYSQAQRWLRIADRLDGTGQIDGYIAPSQSRAEDPYFGKDIAQVHIANDDIVEDRLHPAPCSENACDEGDVSFDRISITFLTQLKCEVSILLCEGHHVQPDTLLKIPQPTFVGGDPDQVRGIRHVLASANIIYVSHEGITMCHSGRCRVTGTMYAGSPSFGTISARVVGCAVPGKITDPRRQPNRA